MGKVQRVLITGVTGFAGSHLADYINKLGGIEVFGTVRPRSSTENIESPVTLLQCDLTDPQSVAKAISRSMPDILFHLAAQSFVPMSFVAPSMTMQANLQGTLNILEAVRQACPETVVHFAGTSEEYGQVYEGELPIVETQPLRPMSQYAASKIAGDYLCQQYARTYNMPIAISRAFNHSGPRRGSMFATSNFALQIALIEAGRQEPVICVGNLDTRRDFSDVRDVVRAYWQLANAGLSTEPYNICSEQDVSIKAMLELLLSYTNIEPTIRTDPSRMRPSDVPVLRGSSTKIHAAMAWQPIIPLSMTLESLLNYWRDKVKAGRR